MIPTKLVLASGETFVGQSPDWFEGEFSGEIVFNTGMVGYPESMTDPSYAGQLLVFTYPLIGNYGVPDPSHWESDQIQVRGIIVSTAATFYDHYASEQSLLDWCQAANVALMTDVDTRALTKVLSHQGVVPAVITTPSKTPTEFVDINQSHLVSQVSIKEPIVTGKGDKTVVVVDCGLKNSILRHLERFPLRLKRVPYNYDFTHEPYDGVLLSNGPGDPIVCQETIAIVKKVLAAKKPTFGICLGTQLMALAIGAKSYKLPFGHRAQNHPCMHLPSGRCYLTSQNHGFAIEENSLPQDWNILFRHLNDNTIQGIAHQLLPFFAVQFHPEATPGPIDTEWLFQKFYDSLSGHAL